MSKIQSTRRKFLKFLGLSAGAGLTGPVALAAFSQHTEIKKLNPKQQEFMLRYEKWMDEFIKVIRIQKTDPANMENQKKMMALTEEKAVLLKPELTEFMKDETFSMIYLASLERMTKEI